MANTATTAISSSHRVTTNVSIHAPVAVWAEFATSTRGRQLTAPASPFESRAALSASFVHVGLIREQDIVKAEVAQVADTHWIQDAVQMIAFVLHHARVKAAHRAVDGFAARAVAAVAQRAP